MRPLASTIDPEPTMSTMCGAHALDRDVDDARHHLVDDVGKGVRFSCPSRGRGAEEKGGENGGKEIAPKCHGVSPELQSAQHKSSAENFST
jgi:hypothetical protein